MPSNVPSAYFVAGGDLGGQHFDGRPNDRIGLIAFARFPDTVCPLTLSHVSLLDLLDGEEPRGVPDEADTNIGDALAWGVDRLRSAGPGRKVLVLLSDGEHNVQLSGAYKPRQAAQLAANLAVPVYTIDAGPPASGAGDDAADRARIAGRQALEAVAALTGGKAFAAHDARSLLRVYREIDALEKGSVTSFQYRRYAEAYSWCAMAALVCLATILAVEMTVWRRIP